MLLTAWFLKNYSVITIKKGY